MKPVEEGKVGEGLVFYQQKGHGRLGGTGPVQLGPVADKQAVFGSQSESFGQVAQPFKAATTAHKVLTPTLARRLWRSPSGLRSARDVAALPDHERARELDDGRLVLIHSGRLDAHDADGRA